MISFLIIHYQREVFLNKLVSVLSSQITSSDEIIVLDNGSNSSLLKLPDNIIIINNESNTGVIKSRKILINKSKNNYLCFLDDDCEVDNKFRNNLYNHIKKYKDTFSLISFKVTDENHKIRKEEFLSNSNFDHEVTFFLGGACCFINEILKSNYLNIYDSFYGMEEYEVALLMHANNQKIIYCPNLIVKHHKTNYNKNSIRFTDFEDKSLKKIRIILKYYPIPFNYIAILAWAFYYTYKRTSCKISFLNFIKLYFKGFKIYK